MSKPQLDSDQREVLEILVRSDEWLSALTLQREASVWPIRPTLDRLRRRKLIESTGERDLTERCWTITAAGKEDLS